VKVKKDIALALSRDKSTISREVRRNKGRNSLYLGYKAQGMSMSRLSSCHKRRRLKSHSQRYKVEQLIMSAMSPAQISGCLKIEYGKSIISHEAIYQWIYSDAVYLSQYLLKAKQKRQRYYNNKSKLRIAN
jgi:IS30 family transposase